MFKHKIIKIGGSLGITLPKKYLEAAELKKGDRIILEMNTEYQTLFMKPPKQTYNPFMTPEFFKWVKKYIYRKYLR
jgi:antitoxin component of MazEF toxin-antitoxin module